MLLSAIKENDNNETRVSISPESVKLFSRLGFEVIIENGAGETSGYQNSNYEEAGAKIVTRSECLKADVCLCVRMPSTDDINNLKSNSLLIGILNPYENKSEFSNLNKNKISSCCMELIPRISRAQSMDVLSSQANLAGYRSVIDAAEQFGKAFPMMMTAAGRVNPAKVMILGVGVAGLQAIATAKRLGAVVSATDVRAATKEQVESLGAKFVDVESKDSGETSGGYAKEMSASYKKKQNAILAETLKKIDIVITTALIPGKKAPLLLSKKMVESMKVGSIIIDLASEFGGNCELTKHGEKVVFKSKKIIGPQNLASSVAQDSSRLFSKNVVNFLMNSCESGKFKGFNWDDEVVKETCVVKNLLKPKKGGN